MNYGKKSHFTIHLSKMVSFKQLPGLVGFLRKKILELGDFSPIIEFDEASIKNSTVLPFQMSIFTDVNLLEIQEALKDKYKYIAYVVQKSSQENP